MTQSDDFAKSIAFSWWPFLVIFKMLSFFEYWLFSGAVFCIEQLQCVVETFLACYFDPKWRFWKVYSLCFVAIFVPFSQCFHCWNISCFLEIFLHRTSAMCCRNVFSMFLYIFNFWRKVTILQSLWLLLGGHFQNVLIFE